MNFTEYQGLARRTQNVHINSHERLEHALHGLCAEVGEIHSIFQKVYQGHPVKMADLIGEMGDALWFLAELADVYGLSLDEIAAANIDKLRKRYPDGFDEDHSVNREV